MKRELLHQVVVITGASGGLGRATAIQFARRGSKLILAARRKDALEETARLCREAGGEAIVVVTDVSRESDVRHLVSAALDACGRIDVWINNAGVTVFSMLEDAPVDVHLRIFETNLYGPIYAARALIPVFRKQKRGTLINVGSTLSKIGQPFAPSYTISKYALHGLSDVLRVQFADEPDIHVCSLLPYAMNTQHFQSGANFLGRNAHVIEPEQAVEKVAQAAVSLAERPRRELHVPRINALGLAWHAVAPRTVERLLLHVLQTWHFKGRTPQTLGDLYEPPSAPARVYGDRPPLVSALGLFAWALCDLARIELDFAAQRARSLARETCAMAGFTLASPATQNSMSR